MKIISHPGAYGRLYGITFQPYHHSAFSLREEVPVQMPTNHRRGGVANECFSADRQVDTYCHVGVASVDYSSAAPSSGEPGESATPAEIFVF